MSWDPKAERISARAAADKARAEAEAIRAQTAAAQRREDAQLEREDDDRRRAQAAQRRQALKETIARHGDKLVPVLAVGSPAVIAWSGQYKFAVDVMQLGVLSPLLPVALEGSVLYAAMLTHKAVDAQLPTARYRALTWVLAAMAAGMNFWHGKEAHGSEVGVALALTSLLSIVLLEMTVALRAGRVSGTNAAAIRQGLIRRLRYPRLSAAAASIAAARGIGAEEAWTAAWIDRYSIGPDSNRRERKVACVVLKRQRGEHLDAVEAGQLRIVDGALVSAQSAPGTDPSERSGERSGGVSVQDLVIEGWAEAGIAEFEQMLAASAHGALMELPAPAEGERSPQDTGERSAEGGERDGERSGERPAKRSWFGRPASGERSRPGKASARKRPRIGNKDRVRQYLADHPDASTNDIHKALKIGESTARRLRGEVLREQSDEQQ